MLIFSDIAPGDWLDGTTHSEQNGVTLCYANGTQRHATNQVGI